MNRRPCIIFRADGDSQIGLGHLIRSAALADMIRGQFECVLATRCNLPLLLQSMQQTFIEIVHLPERCFADEAKDFHLFASTGSLVVLDGYNFTTAYQEQLIALGFDLFCIDDIHAFQFCSRAIINHAGGFLPFDYQALPTTQYFLGPHYSLLRQPFLQAAEKRRSRITGNECLICFGGADPFNQTLDVLANNTVGKYFDTLHVVIGGAYQHKTVLESFAARHSNVALYSDVSAEQMVSLMQRCSYAICSPSTIVYEYLSVGGIVFLVQTADNQKDVIRYFIDEGMAFTLNHLGRVTERQIAESFAKQAFYFDGKSGVRFNKIFKQYFEGKTLVARKANENDLQCCFQWANDPDVRAQSYNQKSISLEEHTHWFQQKLSDRNSFFYILEKEGRPVAQIRFQVENGEAVLGYLAAKEIRSQGVGTAILAKGIEAFITDYQRPVNITGYVKVSNIASQRSFERFAFHKEKATGYPDSYKYTMNYGI